MTDIYPKQMVHPSAQKSVITRTAEKTDNGVTFITAQGTPDRFPPVTVNNPSQESYYRAQGYRVSGEPAAAVQHYDFPMYLQHASAEPVLVTSPAELEARESEGYYGAGKSSAEAFERANATPYHPGRVYEEFPKMIEGKVVDPNNQNGPQRYPMWVNGVTVNNEAEELVARGTQKSEPVVSKIEQSKRKQLSAEQKAAMAAGRAKAREAKAKKVA